MCRPAASQMDVSCAEGLLHFPWGPEPRPRGKLGPRIHRGETCIPGLDNATCLARRLSSQFRPEGLPQCLLGRARNLPVRRGHHQTKNASLTMIMPRRGRGVVATAATAPKCGCFTLSDALTGQPPGDNGLPRGSRTARAAPCGWANFQ